MSAHVQRLIVKGVRQEIEFFLIDRQARNLSPRTIEFYRAELDRLAAYLEGQGVQAVQDIAPEHIRAYLLDLGKTRNAGGVHAAYRAAKVWLRWWQEENDPPDWKNPIKRVQAPKVTREPIQGVTDSEVSAMLATCGRDLLGLRDRAILRTLYDSGVRASELCSLKIGDLVGDALLIRQGKGRKTRTVFIGKKGLKDVTAYLRAKRWNGPDDALFGGRNEWALTASGLRQMLERRAELAGLQAKPSPHDFRRASALSLLRSGVDPITVSRLLGHSDLRTTMIYLKQLPDDLRRAFQRASPGDRL